MTISNNFSEFVSDVQKIIVILEPIRKNNPEDLNKSMQILEQLQQKYAECLDKKWKKSEILFYFREFSKNLLENSGISENSQKILEKKSEEYEKKLEEFVRGNLVDMVKSKHFWKGFSSVFDFSFWNYKK